MGHKVLLADDSITVQKIVKLSLTEEGIEVIAVGNGEQAVQQLETLHPDLVLADVFMPGKDGYEVCEFVKSQPHLKNIPVILLVHAFEPFDPDRAKKVGADHQLTKPFQSIRTLVTTVQELLASAGQTPAMPPVAEASPTMTAPIAVAHIPSQTVDNMEGIEGPFSSSLSSFPAPVVMTAPLLESVSSSAPTAPVMSSVIPDAAPLLISEDSLPVPLTGQNNFQKSDLLPPSELAVLATPEWSTAAPLQNIWSDAPPAPSEASVSQSPPASFYPVSLAAPLISHENSADDVLELSDVLSDTAGVPLQPATSFANQFSTDVPLLAVLGHTPDTEISNSVHSPVEQTSFTNSFDLAAGHIAPPVELHDTTSATTSQDMNHGTVLSTTSAASMQIPESVIEDIVNRVIQRLSTQAIQEIAWEVVPEMAELLIRKHISQNNHLTH